MTPAPAFFDRTSVAVAKDLIGAKLLLDGVGGLIVEAEAYEPQEAASHSFRGPTPRNLAMFGPPARAYVYRSYGIHWCFNIVCRRGGAVLIRALQPTDRLEDMALRRQNAHPMLLCAGPGRLCQALGISGTHNELNLLDSPFQLTLADTDRCVTAGPRIGITKAIHLPWRFGLSGSPYLSRRFKTAR